MNKLDKPTLKLLEKNFLNIQKNIEENLLNLNSKDRISIKENWKRKEGGGGKSISISGDVIEKAAANFSTISGNNL
ncbi:MAG: oxygen-dependent coproporphyrinogen oxidase, partial [Gammaproteobacteria bacterium]|nr:oxygen-dependent coproporphyrinogen oxidase [Gammaproteobacteria bacterium]